MINKIVKNSGWLLLDRLIRLFVGLFVTGMFSRYLGPVEFGHWGYAITLTTIFMPIANLELEQILIKEILLNPLKKESILSTGLILRFFGGLSVGLIVLILNFYIVKNAQVKTLNLILATGFLFLSFEVIDFYYHSQLKPVYSVASRSLSYLVFQALKVILIFSGATLVTIVFTSIFESLLAAGILLIHFLVVEKKKLFLSFDFELVKKLLKQSSPMVVANLIGLLLFKLDQIYIGKMFSPEILGNYLAATRVTELGYVLIAAITAAFYPVIAMEENGDDTLLKLVGFLLVVTLGMSLFTFFLSSQITMLIYGKKFLYSGDILKVHIWTTVPYALTICSRFWFIKKEATKWIIVNTLIGLISAVVLVYFLGISWGVRGIALAICLSMLISSFLSNLFFVPNRQLFKLQLNGILVFLKKK